MMMLSFATILLGLVAWPVRDQTVPVVKVIGGTVVPNGGAPYQVSLQNAKGRHFCGGSILSAEWIITAAHCVSDDKPKDVLVRYNFLNFSQSPVERVAVAQIYLDEWNPTIIDNDIALIKVATSLKLNQKNAKPIEMVPESFEPPAGASTLVIGWGLTSDNGNKRSEVLREVTMPVVDLNKCIEVYRHGVTLTKDMFCVGGDGVHDSCNMDSGGPAVIGGKLAGLVSWGPRHCAQKGFPGVYTKVGYYRKWIHTITGL